MPFTNIVPTNAPSPLAQAGTTLVGVAADTVNGNSFVCTGREQLIVLTGAAPVTITIPASADAEGRIGPGIVDAAVPIATYKMYQVFPVTGWIQSDGMIHVTCSAAATLFVFRPQQ